MQMLAASLHTRRRAKSRLDCGFAQWTNSCSRRSLFAASPLTSFDFLCSTIEHQNKNNEMRAGLVSNARVSEESAPATGTAAAAARSSTMKQFESAQVNFNSSSKKQHQNSRITCSNCSPPAAAAAAAASTMKLSSLSTAKLLLLLISYIHLLSFTAQLGETKSNPIVNSNHNLNQRIRAQQQQQQQHSTVITTHESQHVYANSKPQQHQHQQQLTNHFSSAASPLHRQPYNVTAGRHHLVAPVSVVAGDTQAPLRFHQTNQPAPASFVAPNHRHHHQHQGGGSASGHNRGHHQLLCLVGDGSGLPAKCGPNHEGDAIDTAWAEFKLNLRDSSKDLIRNLDSYWKEFMNFSLDLVYLAREGTMRRLKDSLERQQLNHTDFRHYELAVRTFFESMFHHLTGSELANPQDLPLSTLSSNSNRQVAVDMGEEISQYFRKLHLIHLKRLLERTRKSSSGAQLEIDLECMSSNLKSQARLDALIQEFQSKDQLDQQFGDLVLEQQANVQSIKQSLEFARALLQSLYSARGMFQNLTERANDWMPSQQCHRALARMTTCQQCHTPPPTRRSAPATQLLPESAHLPCENYCLNVVRGCMNDVYELNRYWSNYAGALNLFKQNMIQMNNIENVMGNLDEKLLNFMIKLQQQYNLSLESSPFASDTDTDSEVTASSDQQQQARAGSADLESAKVSKVCSSSSSSS